MQFCLGTITSKWYLLSITKTHKITKWEKKITNWGRYYKVGGKITKRGKKITKWGRCYKVGNNTSFQVKSFHFFSKYQKHKWHRPLIRRDYSGYMNKPHMNLLDEFRSLSASNFFFKILNSLRIYCFEQYPYLEPKQL